jgi:hypothetical protein
MGDGMLCKAGAFICRETPPLDAMTTPERPALEVCGAARDTPPASAPVRLQTTSDEKRMKP